jgi:hypothetical protein
MKAIGKRGLGAALVALVGGLAVAAYYLVRPGASDYFEDKTGSSGLDFVYRNGEEANHYTILESVGGGIGLIDYDRDGMLDVFLTGGGHFGPNKEIRGYPNRLFRNEGNWRFRDVTEEVGLPVQGVFYSHGCAVADYNNDGWPDLLVTGYGRLALYQNQKGRFVETTEAAGLRDQRPVHWSTSAAWGDLTGDGNLDLFVCHYVDWSFANDPACKPAVTAHARDICSPEQFKPLLPALFVADGAGKFKDAGPGAGFVAGNGFGVTLVDLDDDGRLDIYVANDASGNHLYLNQGAGRFAESAVSRGVAYSMNGGLTGSMGVTLADYNHTGFPSLFVTNFQNQLHCLYRNLGAGRFQNAELAAGLALLGQDNVGFGTGFVDFDLDGSEDLVIVHGHVVRHPKEPVTVKQRPTLLRNRHAAKDKPGQTRFEIVTDRGGPYFRTEHLGRGLALGDLDNDGAVDLVISNTNEPAALLRNQAVGRGRWLGIELVGTPCPEPIGAKVTLEVDGRTLTRFVLGGGSYLSSSDRRVVFGLGKARTVGQLTVHWPSGRRQRWNGADLATNRYHRLTEDAAGGK